MDQALIDLDRTPDKSRLGANAIVGVVDGGGPRRCRGVGGACSCSATLAARTQQCCRLAMNIPNGGAHADSNVDIQEFMIAPIGATTFAEAVRQRGDLPRAWSVPATA